MLRTMEERDRWVRWRSGGVNGLGSLGSLRMTHTLRYTVEMYNHRESVLERLPRLPKGAEVSGGGLEASADWVAWVASG